MTMTICPLITSQYQILQNFEFYKILQRNVEILQLSSNSTRCGKLWSLNIPACLFSCSCAMQGCNMIGVISVTG